MTDDRDPMLEALFSTPAALCADDSFAEKTLLHIDRYRRRRRLLRLLAEITILFGAWIVSEPLHALAVQMMPWIMSSLVDAGDGPLAQLLAPMNSVAGAIAVLTLLGGAVYRRLFRSR